MTFWEGLLRGGRVIFTKCQIKKLVAGTGKMERVFAGRAQNKWKEEKEGSKFTRKGIGEKDLGKGESGGVLGNGGGSK